MALRVTLGYVSIGGASLLFPLYALSIGDGAFLVGVLAVTPLATSPWQLAVVNAGL